MQIDVAIHMFLQSLKDCGNKLIDLCKFTDLLFSEDLHIEDDYSNSGLIYFSVGSEEVHKEGDPSSHVWYYGGWKCKIKLPPEPCHLMGFAPCHLREHVLRIFLLRQAKILLGAEATRFHLDEIGDMLCEAGMTQLDDKVWDILRENAKPLRDIDERD